MTHNAARTNTEPVVDLQNVHKEFATRRGEVPVVAVETVNVAIREGEFFSMLGPSGCGKTTTLRMIAGFEEPTRGKVLIAGRDMVGIPAFHRPVNTVFQDYALFPHMTVGQNIAFGLEMEGRSRQEIERRVREILELVELPDMAKRYPKQLSGGQQQRVALARALVKHPRVLLLDEPLGALDLKLRKQMQLELKQMQRQLGITFIYVTHDQEEALTISDRIAVMNKGQLLQIGSPGEIYDRPVTRFVADFIGEMNFLPACVERSEGDDVVVQVDNRLPLRVNRHGSAVQANDQVNIAIRPEKIELRSASDATENALPGTIEDEIFIGTDMRYVVRLTEYCKMVVRAQNSLHSERFVEGTAVKAVCSPEYALILNR